MAKTQEASWKNAAAMFGGTEVNVKQAEIAAEPEDDDAALDWDEQIAPNENDENYVTLKPGTYTYVVTKFERGEYAGNPEKNKKPCHTANVWIKVKTSEGVAIIKHIFYLKKKQAFLIRAFFASLGFDHAKDNDAFVPDWDAVVGEGGACEVTVNEYNGKLYNHVDKFLKV